MTPHIHYTKPTTIHTEPDTDNGGALLLRVFTYVQMIEHIKKIGVKKKFRWGGGGVLNFFFRKTILSYFTFYAISTLKKIETLRLSIRPSITFSLLVKWEVVSPNTGSRWGQLESISIFYSLDLILYLKLGGGGRV